MEEVYQALYRKWRPRTFDDVVGQSHITETLKSQVASGRPAHAYLFTGTRGCGKTTCAKILARAVNCENPVNGNPCNVCPTCVGLENGDILDVTEMDAASNNGVEDVRALREEAIYSPTSCRKRVYIIDEVHMLSGAAFNALLKIMEEPPEHLMFILATTELHKVPATILSRCQRYSFKRIHPEDITQRLRYIAGEEHLELTEDGAAVLARLADGALRDALSLLDQCAAGGGVIDKQAVFDSLGLAGNTQTAHLMLAIEKRAAEQALTLLSDLYTKGKDIRSVLDELTILGRDLMLCMAAPKNGVTLMTGGYDEATLKALSKHVNMQRLTQILDELRGAQSRLRLSTNPRLEAELCLIRLCDITLDSTPAGLEARIARLEQQLANGVVVQQVPENEKKNEVTEGSWDEAPPLEDWDAPPDPEISEFSAPEERMSAPTASVSADSLNWNALKKEIQIKLNSDRATQGAGAFIENFTAVLQGSTLKLYDDGPKAQFGKRMLDDEETRKIIGEIVSSRLGNPVEVRVEIGKCPEKVSSQSTSAETSGGMNELLEQLNQANVPVDVIQ